MYRDIADDFGVPTNAYTMAATLPLCEALNESIPSGRFEDTMITLYSRRDPSGNVYALKTLYANSHVLKTVPYFNRLLSGSFGETESDDSSETIDDSELADDYGYWSDSDLEEGADIADSATKSTDTRTERKGPPERGKVIKIEDVAFITFQAFLLYLYTDDIEFAPYGSGENRKSRVPEMSSVSEDSIPRPSPKSIYRLADKYDVPFLKELAFASIKDGLEKCDIVEEAFSEFASEYPEVMTEQVNHLASVWFRGDRESAEYIGERIDRKVESYAKGNLDHTTEAMTLLWELSREDENSCQSPKTEQRTQSAITPVQATTSKPWSPPERPKRGLKNALIKSIRNGAFFDKKYWTKHSRTAKALRPLYISTVVAGERLSRIDRLVKLYREDDCLDAGSLFEDSDYEGHPEQGCGTATEEQDAEREDSKRETLPLPVITLGSLSSWRCLFFYLCTGIIEFAPLKSQGTEMRARYIQAKTTSDRPPPCSPKVIYSLAGALDIKPLRDFAFNDIRSKITSANVVVELFSSFASRESEVMKMHCDLLGDNFREESVTASAADAIKNMAGGNAAHRASALKLALRNGRLKREKLFRCPLRSCKFHKTPYSSTGLRPTTCPRGHSYTRGGTSEDGRSQDGSSPGE